MNRRLAAATTAVSAALAATMCVPSPARAADAPIIDIGIAEGAIVNGPIVFRPTVADGADITAIHINAVAGTFGDLSQGDYAAPWELHWDPLNFGDQDVTLSLIAVDSAGNWTETDPVTVYVDRWGPTYRFENYPAEPGWGGWYVSVRQPLRISATDRAGLNRVELLQNGRLVRTVDLGNKTAGKVALALDPATKNGVVTLTIRLVDRFGNVTSNDFTATVDITPPTGVFRPSGTLLRGTFTAWPYDLHDNVYVRSMASYLDDHKGGGATDRSPLSVRVNSRAVKDGKHTLSFELTDLAGNTGVVRRTVYIDNTVPSIAVTKAPKNKAKLTKKVTLKAKASDKYGVAKVQLLVNGKVVATDVKAGYQFTLNPKKYGKKFTVQMRAYDKAGNVRSSAKRTYRR
ncbi:Ig-like domain-containing protein [Actinoplanes sp. ATCC 53533]|uniref:Ig-like domain-containing protein n=1 Tax=Actinoplanes sp. ATCC 53533 TaxID=1288362 RepID=UPI00131530E1|nr:Ig-like domain-containing protein [Actinoplanes sp. ATCC 53533]